MLSLGWDCSSKSSFKKNTNLEVKSFVDHTCSVSNLNDFKNLYTPSKSNIIICGHFILQYYDLYKTEELPNLEGSNFSPKVTLSTINFLY